MDAIQDGIPGYGSMMEGRIEILELWLDDPIAANSEGLLAKQQVKYPA
jgi:hypothetical protein